MVSVLINEMEEYAKVNNVPIMSRDTIDKIRDVILNNNISSILELGTAIAYSTICFASIDNNIKITSIERDSSRYNKAVENVNISKLKNIKLIYGDIDEVSIEDNYDLLIIDASKAQNEKFFNRFKNNLNNNGIIIIDNLSFHGLVGKSDEIKSKNLRSMVKKIESFIEFLDNLTDFNVEYFLVGDKIAVCKKKNI